MKKYLLYAMGEIVLVVVGILIAMQINNWNEERQQNERYTQRLQKTYHEIAKRLQHLDGEIWADRFAINIIDSVTLHPEPAEKALFFTLALLAPVRLVEVSDQFVQTQIPGEALSEKQTELNKLIYAFWRPGLTAIHFPKLQKLIEGSDLPIPAVTQYLNLSTRPQNMDFSYFTKDEVNSFRSLQKTMAFQSALKTERTNLDNKLGAFYIVKNNGQEVMKAIKAYRPNVHVAFEEIGIIGDAIGSWENSVAMNRKPGTESTWQLDTTLTKGYVKFRSHNSWEENWGGFSFPEGEAITIGDDIPVMPGRYHIELDLVKGRYQFQKL